MASLERRIHPRAFEVEGCLGLLGLRPSELRLDLLAAAVVLPDREPALLDREDLALLLAARLVQARLRPELALGKVPRPRDLAPDELQELGFVLQRRDVVPMPQGLMLQIRLEAGNLGVSLSEHEPDLPVVEGDQPVVGAHPLAFEHIDRLHVGVDRRGQVGDARGVDKREEHELGGSRFPALRPPPPPARIVPRHRGARVPACS